MPRVEYDDRCHIAVSTLDEISSIAVFSLVAAFTLLILGRFAPRCGASGDRGYAGLRRDRVAVSPCRLGFSDGGSLCLGAGFKSRFAVIRAFIAAALFLTAPNRVFLR
jgi:hypothetical protein